MAVSQASQDSNCVGPAGITSDSVGTASWISTLVMSLRLCECCHGRGRGAGRDEMRIFHFGDYDRCLQEGKGQKPLDKIANLCYNIIEMVLRV